MPVVTSPLPVTVSRVGPSRAGDRRLAKEVQDLAQLHLISRGNIELRVVDQVRHADLGVREGNAANGTPVFQ